MKMALTATCYCADCGIQPVPFFVDGAVQYLEHRPFPLPSGQICPNSGKKFKAALIEVEEITE